MHILHLNFYVNKKGRKEYGEKQMKHNKNWLRVIVAKLPVKKNIRNDNHQQQKNQHDSVKLHNGDICILKHKDSFFCNNSILFIVLKKKAYICASKNAFLQVS